MYYKGEKMEGTASPANTDFHGHGEAIRRVLRERIPSKRRMRVLDVGTGLGLNTAFLAGHISNNSEIWTIDPSEEVLANVRVALGNKKKAASRVNFVRASAENLDFPDGFFDVIVSVMVMHHLEDARAVLKELTRVLADGGRLLIADYKPEASHELEFQTRHKEADFFAPEFIRAVTAKLGLAPHLAESELWYLVDARKDKKNKKWVAD
jgi:ubiquinone/menaquinone biosynthesis C-methylase UbiE